MSVTLRPMRWWDIERVMPVEQELFGDEPWSERMFWSELAQTDTRYYLVATVSGGAAGTDPGGAAGTDPGDAADAGPGAAVGSAGPAVAPADGHETELLLGYGGLCVYPDEAFVQTLAVRRSAQGRGVGRALLEALLAEAAGRGRSTVGLEVRADNDGAQRLYRRYGFEPVARRRGYYQPSGVDAIIMQRTPSSATRVGQ